MNQIIVVENDFLISGELCKLFEKRNITVIKTEISNYSEDINSINLTGLNNDGLLCSEQFEKKLGGKENLISFARNAKINKIIIIHEDKNTKNYKINSELGGALKRLIISNIHDQLIHEIIFHICCPEIFLQRDVRVL